MALLCGHQWDLLVRARRLKQAEKTACSRRPTPLFGLISQKRGFGAKRRLGTAAARCCYNTIECDLNKPMYVLLCEKMTGCVDLPVDRDLRDLPVSRDLRAHHRRLITGNRTSRRLPIRPPLFGLISQKHGFGQKRRLGTTVAVTHFVHGCWHKNCMFAPLLHLDT